jgi:hypothetical protein
LSEYGEDVVDELKHSRKITSHYTVADLMDIYDKYDKKLAELRK